MEDCSRSSGSIETGGVSGDVNNERRSPSLKGRVAIVTGAAQGIGFAVAQALVRIGSEVALVDIDAGELDIAVGKLRSEGANVTGVLGSVAESKEARAIVGKVLNDHGRVDVLINNAGITRDAQLVDMSDDDFDSAIAVNLRGAFLMTRCVLPSMMKNEYGRIINITSTAGLIGSPGRANYAAAKMGVVGLGQSLALELAGQSITVNAVAPFAWTKLTESWPGLQRLEPSTVELMKGLKPEYVAAVIAYLATPAAGSINGQVFSVRGKEIMIFSQPRPVWSIDHRGKWEVGDLASVIPSRFARFMTPLESSASYFSYDPLV